MCDKAKEGNAEEEYALHLVIVSLWPRLEQQSLDHIGYKFLLWGHLRILETLRKDVKHVRCTVFGKTANFEILFLYID